MTTQQEVGQWYSTTAEIDRYGIHGWVTRYDENLWTGGVWLDGEPTVLDFYASPGEAAAAVEAEMEALSGRAVQA